MKSFTRRNFLGGMIAAGALWALPRSWAEAPQLTSGRKLLLIHLNGGNDGLNTIIPGNDPLYRKLRPTLAVPPKDLLGLEGGMSMHPALRELHQLYEKGKLGILQGVGYPDPSLSHFRSTEVWQSGTLLGGSEGWIGRYLDRSATCEKAMAVGSSPPLTLATRRGPAPTFEDPERFLLPTALQTAGDLYGRAATQSGALGEVGRLGQRALAVAAKLGRIRPGQRPEGGGLARDLRLALALLEADLGLEVLHLSMSGFDTHEGQANRHSDLLRQLGRALAGFQTELAARGLEDQVVTMIYSEFGRRPQENSSGGTDHGTAGPILVLGSKARPGLLGSSPSLAQMEGDNLRYSLDFRSVYAGLVRDWLRTDPVPLVGNFDPFSCVL